MIIVSWLRKLNFFNLKVEKTQPKHNILGGAKVDYRKLKGKIKEVFDTQGAFAKAMGLSYTSINQKVNDKVEWSSSEIAKACDLLYIPLTEAHLYFFTPKVEKSQL